MGYSPNGTDNDLATNECPGWQCLTSFQMPQVVSVQTLYPKNRKATCDMGFALKTLYHSFPFVCSSEINIRWSLAGIHIPRRVSLRVKRLEFSANASSPYSINIFLSVFHQEKPLHRNSDFHATEDNRGITQRAKRSPSKQPETGMFFFSVCFFGREGIYHHSLLLCLLSSHLDTEVVRWHLRFIVSQVSPSVFFGLKLQIRCI